MKGKSFQMAWQLEKKKRKKKPCCHEKKKQQLFIHYLLEFKNFECLVHYRKIIMLC